MKETAILFGSHRGLVGVVTHPADGPPRVRRALVMANIGVSHHVGPFRLYVELARAVAALGWYALRFDLAGLGDSAPRSGGQTPGEQAQADVREAIDWLQDKLGVAEVVLVGLCSGVDTVHPVTVTDPRVVGAVFVDGYVYPTWGYYVRRHTLRYLQLGRWHRFGRRLAHRSRRARTTARMPEAAAPVFQREFPTRAQFRADIGRAVSRGARLLFIYTGTFDHHYNAARQVYEMLGRAVPREAVDVEVIRGADHLFSAAAHRARFFGRVQQWLSGFATKADPRVWRSTALKPGGSTTPAADGEAGTASRTHAAP